MLRGWPWWASELVWTVIFVGSAYGIGHVVRALVGMRLGRLAERTRAQWDDQIVRELTRRIPFWSVLIGAYTAIPHWHLSAEAHLRVERVISGLGVASVTFAAAALSSRLLVLYGPRAAPSLPVSTLTQNVARIVIVVVGVLIIIRSFGYEITPLLTLLGVGGLAVALALQEPLSNLFAGVFVTLAGQVRIGDYIRLDSGVEGYVVDFNWRSTRLKQLGDNLVIVPNAKLSQAVVTNFSLPVKEMSTGVDLTVDWGCDLAIVERIALAVATDVMREVRGGVPHAEPSVRFQSVTDTGIRVSVGVRVREFVDQFPVKHELVRRLHAALAREGISLPLQRTVSVRAREETDSGGPA